ADLRHRATRPARDGAEGELADELRLLGIPRLDRVARVLDDRERLAAQDGGALLVGVVLDDAGRGDRLERVHEELRRPLARRRVQQHLPVVVEDLAALRVEDREPGGRDRVRLHAAEDVAVHALVRVHLPARDRDELAPRPRRVAERVPAVGERLHVADERERVQLRRVVAEVRQPRPRAGRPVAELEERLHEVGVRLDAQPAEVLQHRRGGELRDPRVVHHVDVELAGLREPVVERLLEEARVVVLEVLDLDPGLALEERDDLLLEGAQAAVDEGADDHLALGGARGRRGAGGRTSGRAEQRRGCDGDAEPGRPRDELRARQRPTAPATLLRRRARGTFVVGGHSMLLSVVLPSPGAAAQAGRRESKRSPRCTTVTPSASKKQALAGSSRMPTGAPMGASQPRSARSSTTAPPSRTSTSVSLPSGSTTYT